MGLFELREDQQRALTMLRQSVASGKRRPAVQAPTGFGKTVLGAHIVHGAKQRGKRVVFVVPALSLIDQTFERFRQNGIDPADMGVLQGDHPWRRPGAPIQIASVQTLCRRGMPETDLVVVDECHIRSEWLHAYLTSEESRSVLAVGLSATPWAAGMGMVYDDLIRPVSMRELIEKGLLSKFRVFASSHPDLTGVKTVAGDYHEGQLAQRMSQPQLVGDIVSTWMAKASGLPTLCFCVNRAHARLVHDQFAREGIAVAYVDAETPREEREVIGRKLAAREIDVVCNIGTLTTGIDWDVRCIILARPTKSEMLFVQIIGRGLRTAEGKDHCLILDHSDTHIRLGMVDEIDYTELSKNKKRASSKGGEEKEDRLPLPLECDACGCLVPHTMSECPSCGKMIRKRVNVETAEGELMEITRGRRGKPMKLTDQLAAKGKQRVYLELLAFADERNRSKGWAAHAYRTIFGVWPRGLHEEFIGTYPSADLRAFVRQKDIAFAKGMARRGAA